MATKAPKSQSPLDSYKIRRYIESRLRRDVPLTEIARDVSIHHGIPTSPDSIRRFKKRHNIQSFNLASTPAKAAPSKPAAKAPAKKALNYKQYTSNGDKCILIFLPGKAPMPVTNDNPRYDEIVAAVKAGDESVVDIIDPAKAVDEKFKSVSERVKIQGGTVLFDGNPMDNALTQLIVRTLEAGEDFQYLVNFFENVMLNSNTHSQEMLMKWIAAETLSITPEGHIVGYKGVRLKNGKPVSREEGKAIVNDEWVEGQIPNEDGNVIEMPRDLVTHDPSVPCSHGLHVGTWKYASNFSSTRLEVRVNPRDVVSVPNDCSNQKIRCCRYKVVGVVEKPYTKPIVK